MWARVVVRWYDVRDRLWFIPAVLTVLAAALALAMVRVDRSLAIPPDAETDWLFGAGTAGAREVLSVIAGTTITVTGVVFSITIVALQLASSQFTPRVLRTFTGDRGNQLVLGVFIATFAYALLVLRTVRDAPGAGREPFVPAASVTVAIGLGVLSIGFLIYYIDHAANSIRASVVIDRAARDVLGLIDRLSPIGTAPPSAARGEPPAGSPAVVRAEASGYLQSIDEPALFALGGADGLTIRIEPAAGEFVLPGAVVASVWPTTAADDRLREGVHRSLVLGPERTLQADIELGLRQIADIAVRALSPGVNDPTTATICIDRLAETLVTLAGREQPLAIRMGPEGRVRVVLPVPRFSDLVQTAFSQIRHFGAGDVVVAAHLARTLGGMAQLVPPRARPPLVREARLVIASARALEPLPADLAMVEEAGRWAATDSGSAP